MMDFSTAVEKGQPLNRKFVFSMEKMSPLSFLTGTPYLSEIATKGLLCPSCKYEHPRSNQFPKRLLAFFALPPILSLASSTKCGIPFLFRTLDAAIPAIPAPTIITSVFRLQCANKKISFNWKVQKLICILSLYWFWSNIY